MTRNRQDGLYLLLLGSVIFVVAGSAMKVMTNNSAADFKGVYNQRRSACPPARGLYCVSRSKRLCGVANAAPSVLGHLDGGSSLPQVLLI